MSQPPRNLISCIILVTACIIISGCDYPATGSPTPAHAINSPTVAVRLTSTTTQTPIQIQTLEPPTLTPTPTALIDTVRGLRQWLPEPILVEVGVIHDLKRDPFDRDPSLVLYGDGTLLRKDCLATFCNYTSAQLNTHQICRLLNTIEAYGFFEYTPSSYIPPLTGGQITYLEVSAWRTQQIALYQLTDWLEDPGWLDRLLDCNNCRKPPEIKPALSNTYWLLHEFSVSNAVSYHPNSLAVWLSTPDLAGDPVDWTLSSPSLLRLAGMSACPDASQQQSVILSGSEAERVANYINLNINRGLAPVFREGSSIYQVTTHWLLPYEQAAGCGESTNSFPSSDIPLATEMMTCRYSDGIIPTPTRAP